MWNTGVYPTVMTVGWLSTTIWAVNSVATVGTLSTWPKTSPLVMSFSPMPLTLNPILSPGSACCSCSWCISIDLTSPETPFPSLPGTTMTLSLTFIIPVSTLPTGTTPMPVILYTSWIGSLNGRLVGFSGGWNKSINSSKVGPLNQLILSNFSCLFPTASILFTATAIWFTPRVLQSQICSFVCAITPSAAATTRMPASTWLAPVIIFLIKSLCPGASIIVNSYLLVTNFLWLKSIVTPLSLSSFKLSITNANSNPAFPNSWAFSFSFLMVCSLIFPESYSNLPTVVLFPWST